MQLATNYSCSVAGLTQCFDSLHETTPELEFKLLTEAHCCTMHHNCELRLSHAFAADISVEPIYYDSYLVCSLYICLI